MKAAPSSGLMSGKPAEFIFVGKTGGIQGFCVLPCGELKPLISCDLSRGREPIPLVSPAGSRLLYATLGNDHARPVDHGVLFAFRVERDGKLPPLAEPIRLPASLAQLFLHPNGRHLYLAMEGDPFCTFTSVQMDA